MTTAPHLPGVLLVCDPEEVAAFGEPLRQPMSTGPLKTWTASDPDEALALFRAHHPEVLVVAASMRGGAPEQLIERVRAAVGRAEVAVVVVGNLAGPMSTALDAAELGGDRFVSRPLSPKALRYAVAVSIDAARLARGGRISAGAVVGELGDDPTGSYRQAQRARWARLADSFTDSGAAELAPDEGSAAGEVPGEDRGEALAQARADAGDERRGPVGGEAAPNPRPLVIQPRRHSAPMLIDRATAAGALSQFGRATERISVEEMRAEMQAAEAARSARRTAQRTNPQVVGQAVDQPVGQAVDSAVGQAGARTGPTTERLSAQEMRAEVREAESMQPVEHLARTTERLSAQELSDELSDVSGVNDLSGVHDVSDVGYAHQAHDLREDLSAGPRPPGRRTTERISLEEMRAEGLIGSLPGEQSPGGERGRSSAGRTTERITLEEMRAEGLDPELYRAQARAQVAEPGEDRGGADSPWPDSDLEPTRKRSPADKLRPGAIGKLDPREDPAQDLPGPPVEKLIDDGPVDDSPWAERTPVYTRKAERAAMSSLTSRSASRSASSLASLSSLSSLPAGRDEPAAPSLAAEAADAAVLPAAAHVASPSSSLPAPAPQALSAPQAPQASQASASSRRPPSPSPGSSSVSLPRAPSSSRSPAPSASSLSASSAPSPASSSSAALPPAVLAADSDDAVWSAPELLAQLHEAAAEVAPPVAPPTPISPPGGREFARQLRQKMSAMAQRLFANQGGDALDAALDAAAAPQHDHQIEFDLAALVEEPALSNAPEIIGLRTSITPLPARETQPGSSWDGGSKERERVPDTGELVRGSCDAPAIVVRMWTMSATGRVTFFRGDIEKIVFFDQGRPVFASSTELHDRMGELLYREGKITHAQYMHSKSLVAESGRRMGEVLVELGYLKRRELYPAVRRHVEDIIYSLFAWDHGTYRITLEERATTERIRLARHPEALVLEGIRRKLDRHVLERLVGPPSTVLELHDRERLAGLAAAIELTAEERAGLAAIDGQADLPMLARAAGIAVAAVLPLAWALIVLGYVSARRDGAEVTDETAHVGESDLAIDRERVRARWQLVAEADYFTLLGVRRDATSFEIRRAYEAARRDFAAEGFPGELRHELARELDDIATVLDEAFRVLRDDPLRREYLSHLVD